MTGVLTLNGILIGLVGATYWDRIQSIDDHLLTLSLAVAENRGKAREANDNRIEITNSLWKKREDLLYSLKGTMLMFILSSTTSLVATLYIPPANIVWTNAILIVLIGTLIAGLITLMSTIGGSPIVLSNEPEITT